MSAPTRQWRSILGEPFWLTLAALLGLSVLTAVPVYAACALVWPDLTGTAATLIAVGCYLVAVPITWWLLRERRR